jgi:site-specific recombinase XerD
LVADPKLRASSAHWLRHSYVTYLLDSGAPLKVAQENAGHSNVGTTMHYRHVAQTDRHEATRSLSLTKSESKKNLDG